VQKIPATMNLPLSGEASHRMGELKGKRWAELGGSALKAKGAGECVPAECRVSGDIVHRHRTNVGTGV
jgi:hypothetical protein